jgi:hypothetical protein
MYAITYAETCIKCGMGDALLAGLGLIASLESNLVEIVALSLADARLSHMRTTDRL